MYAYIIWIMHDQDRNTVEESECQREEPGKERILLIVE